MKRKRIKIDAPMLTHDEAVIITGEIAEASHALSVDAEQMNKKLDAIKAEHEDRQLVLSAVITEKTALLERWINANPDVLGTSRSIEFPRAVVGFRRGMPQVKPIKGMTFSAVLRLIAGESDGYRFISVRPPELNKPAIIAARESETELFARVGIEVIQVDRFYVDPKTSPPAEAPK